MMKLIIDFFGGDVTTLKRTVGLPLLTLYGLGNILGAGIYVLIGDVVGISGNNSPLAFLVAMVIAGFTGFSYMELSSRYPTSASVPVYLFEAFNQSRFSTIAGLLIVISGISSAAALSLGFAGYLLAMVGIPKLAASLFLLILLGVIAIRGIGESAKFASIFTFIEMLGLLIVIIAGRDFLFSYDYTKILLIDPAIGWGGVLAGAFLAFYAFIGFEDMVNIGEEVKNPRRNMAYAILLSLGIATVLYLAVVVISIGVMPNEILAASDTPLKLVLESISSVNPLIITLIGLSATINGALVQIIMGSRVLYGLAERGWIHRKFIELHVKTRTPVFATLVVLALTAIASVALPLVSLAKITSMFVLVVFSLVNLSLIIIKLKSRIKASFNNPIIIPIIGLVSSVGIILAQAFSW